MQQTLSLKSANQAQTEHRSEWRRLWMTFTRNKLAVVGMIMVILIVLVAIAAPSIAPHDPLAQSARDKLTAPESAYPLGRDSYGRGILSRIIFGTRVSLTVGIASVLLGGILGTAMGVVAGYKGGKIETVIMRIVDTLLAFPDLITGLLVVAVLGGGFDKIIIAIGIVISPRFARMAHAPTLSLRETEFISAARAIGVTDGRMLMRHILPNILGEILVMGSLWTAAAIRIEANLSFVGLSVPPPTATWGQMIQEGTRYLSTAPWFSIAPGLAILVTVLAFNLLGDGLRDVLDPKLQGGS